MQVCVGGCPAVQPGLTLWGPVTHRAPPDFPGEKTGVSYHSLLQAWAFFPGGSSGEESACNSGDLGLIPGLGRSPGEGKVYPLQYSGLRNSMGYIVHGIEKRHN